MTETKLLAPTHSRLSLALPHCPLLSIARPTELSPRPRREASLVLVGQEPLVCVHVATSTSGVATITNPAITSLTCFPSELGCVHRGHGYVPAPHTVTLEQQAHTCEIPTLSHGRLGSP